MFNPVSGTLMHFSNLKHIQPETHTILFSFNYQKKLKFKTNNILKKLRMFTKKVDMEASDMTVIGTHKKLKKTFLELTQQQFRLMSFGQLLMSSPLDLENSFQLIEFSEINLWMLRI
jgi:hypothetical protein